MEHSAESFINFAALKNTSVKQKPFPYLVIPNFINPAYLSTLTKAFPDISHRGSIPASSVHAEPLFKQFLVELEGSELKNLIAEKFDLPLQDKPTMLTLRGYTTEKDGRIHTDSKSKLITVLIYMNDTWNEEGGKLRLLNNQHSLDDYVEEVTPTAGTCIIFKVTPNCWHGHKPFEGKRLSLQLNYLASDAALNKHLNHHRFTALLKKWFPKFFKHQEEENY